MIWRKREYRLRSINRNENGIHFQKLGDRKRVVDSGQSTMCTGLFFTLFLSVLLAAHLQMEMFRSSSDYMEDALAASGLASALIDIQEYGKTHVIRIPDAKAAYERYCLCLKNNLGLNENWEADNRKLISGKVRIENYTIYNVKGTKVEISRFDEAGESSAEGKLGEVSAPNGQIIQYTSIYSEISYPIQGVFGIELEARKGKLVDVVGRE